MNLPQSLLKVGVYIDVSNLVMNGGFGMRYEVLRQFACRDGAVPMRLNAYVSFDRSSLICAKSGAPSASTFPSWATTIGAWSIISNGNAGGHNASASSHLIPKRKNVRCAPAPPSTPKSAKPTASAVTWRGNMPHRYWQRCFPADGYSPSQMHPAPMSTRFATRAAA